MNKLIRYILGYVIGFFTFMLFIPFMIYILSKFFDSLIRIKIINSLNVQLIIAAPFFLLGIFFIGWSTIALFKIGKGGPAEGFGIAISPPTEKLVIVGPYKYTRNPMVFGAFLVYFSLSIFLDSLLCFLVLLVFLFTAVIYLKFSEEKRLVKDFGNDFIEYKKKVPMIIPFIKVKR